MVERDCGKAWVPLCCKLGWMKKHIIHLLGQSIQVNPTSFYFIFCDDVLVMIPMMISRL